MSDDNKRIIPDGAHHSGLMKDYGGRYNPEFSERHAEAAESLLKDAVIRADAADVEIAQLTREVDGLRRLLVEVREQCLFAEDDGQIGVSEDVVIPSEMFDRICTAINADKETG